MNLETFMSQCIPTLLMLSVVDEDTTKYIEHIENKERKKFAKIMVKQAKDEERWDRETSNPYQIAYRFRPAGEIDSAFIIIFAGGPISENGFEDLKNLISQHLDQYKQELELLLGMKKNNTLWHYSKRFAFSLN